MDERGSIETERLRLDPIGPGKADDLLRLHRDPGIAQWYGGPWTPQDARTAAFDELNAAEVVSFTETYNHRSRAVMERLGFQFSREIRHRDEPFALYTLQRP